MSSVSAEEQQRRDAILRERYLKFLAKMADQPATIEMCENTTVTATIKAIQPTSEHVIVENLATPIGTIDKAVLRASDIVRICVKVGETEEEEQKANG